MPPLGLLIGGLNFTDIKITLKEAVVDAAGKAHAAVTLNLGNFIQSLVDFTIIAFAVFLLVKAINRMNRKAEEAAAVATPTKQEELLAEIRDLLRKK
jgi:large conductance mechanosensitive channel